MTLRPRLPAPTAACLLFLLLWTHSGRLAAPAAVAFADRQAFEEKAAAQLQKSPYNVADWGLIVMDADTGELVYARDFDRPFIPASNRKLFSSAFALDTLGGEYQFETRLEYTGSIDADGTLKGDLIVRASGDPTISSRFRSDRSATGVFREWTQALKDLGVRRVAGHLIIDTSQFAQPVMRGDGWLADYASDYYAAPAGAFSFNENVLAVTVKPTSAGQRPDITLYPVVRSFSVLNRATTKAGGSSSIEVVRQTDANVIEIKGSIPRNESAGVYRVAVQDPCRYGAEVLYNTLLAADIAVAGGIGVTDDPLHVRRPGKLVATHRSPPLREILKHINESSNNFMAEMVYLAAGRAATGRPASYAVSREAERLFWQRLGLRDAEALHAADGSGLSRFNQFTPRAFCELLIRMRGHSEFDIFAESLAVSGSSGTLRSRMTGKDYRDRVRGKTGYISQVSCLSGYLVNRSDRTLVFSIMVNGFTCSNATIKGAQDRLCQWLVDTREGDNTVVTIRATPAKELIGG